MVSATLCKAKKVLRVRNEFHVVNGIYLGHAYFQ